MRAFNWKPSLPIPFTKRVPSQQPPAKPEKAQISAPSNFRVLTVGGEALQQRLARMPDAGPQRPPALEDGPLRTLVPGKGLVSDPSQFRVVTAGGDALMERIARMPDAGPQNRFRGIKPIPPAGHGAEPSVSSSMVNHGSHDGDTTGRVPPSAGWRDGFAGMGADSLRSGLWPSPEGSVRSVGGEASGIPAHGGSVPWIGREAEGHGRTPGEPKVRFGPSLFDAERSAFAPGDRNKPLPPTPGYEAFASGRLPAPDAPVPPRDGVVIPHDRDTPAAIRDFWKMADPIIDAQMASGKSLWDVVESRDFRMLERQWGRVVGQGFDDPQRPLPPGHGHLAAGPSGSPSDPARPASGGSDTRPEASTSTPRTDSRAADSLAPMDPEAARALWREQRRKWKTDNQTGGPARGGTNM